MPLRVLRDNFGAASKAVLAILLSGTVIFSSLAASSPAIHHWLHADAASADHSCVVTLFAAGQVNAAVTFVAAIAIVLACFSYIFPAVSFNISPPVHNFSVSRAPPVQVCL